MAGTFQDKARFFGARLMGLDSIDFYQALEIDPKATQQEVRDAYKK